MAPRILVVDRNQAFATMLKEMLETDGGYEVELTHAGSDALALLPETDFDLTIVDMDLDPGDMGFSQLAQGIRQFRPAMRLMLIPLMGEELGAEARKLDIQGTLSKPFFVDDLLPSIEEALAKPVAPPSPGKPEPAADVAPEAPAMPRQAAPDIQALLSELARETNAESVWLLSRQPGAERVIAQASVRSGTNLEALAYVILAAVQSAQALGRFLGQPDEPFEHNMFENKALRLYITTLPQNLLLMIVTPVATPLGTVRYNLRRASRTLDNVALT